MSKVKKQEKEKLTCLQCNKEKVKDTNFYNSNSSLYKHIKKAPICKACIKELIDYDNMDTIYTVLQQLDIKFDPEYWQKAVESNVDTFGKYVTMANSLPQFEGTSWKDSKFEQENKNNYNSGNINIDDEKINDTILNFTVTEDMIKKWGRNYKQEDYIKLEEFYYKMKDSNKIETHQDETYLRKLAVISLKMDKELEDGNYQQVKQLGDLFSKYMADSKFRAMDQTDASKTGGLRTFSQIYAEVEKDEFIPPWEEYKIVKNIDQDIVDKTIMYILNYTLKLNKAPQLTSPPSDTPKLEGDLNGES